MVSCGGGDRVSTEVKVAWIVGVSDGRVSKLVLFECLVCVGSCCVVCGQVWRRGCRRRRWVLLD
jgi:hypothetical protein